MVRQARLGLRVGIAKHAVIQHRLRCGRYAERGFCVGVPGFERKRVERTYFEVGHVALHGQVTSLAVACDSAQGQWMLLQAKQEQGSGRDARAGARHPVQAPDKACVREEVANSEVHGCHLQWDSGSATFFLWKPPPAYPRVRSPGHMPSAPVLCQVEMKENKRYGWMEICGGGWTWDK